MSLPLVCGIVLLARLVLPARFYTQQSSSDAAPAADKKMNATKISGARRSGGSFGHFFFCAAGIQLCYIVWGGAQERIVGHPYGNERFTYSSVLLSLNKILSGALGAFMFFRQANPTFQTPPLFFAYAALSNFLSGWCQYEALRHTIFPIVVVFKASKMIPVMGLGTIFFGKKYVTYEYAVAMVVALGVSLSVIGGSTSATGSSQVNMLGLGLMVAYACADAFTSNWQSHVFKTCGTASLEMMLGMNACAALLASFSAITSNQLLPCMSFAGRHPSITLHIFALAVASAGGQWFIFETIKHHGPLVFATIMVVRQCLNVCVSSVIFGHQFSAATVGGFMVVFAALFAKPVLKRRYSSELTL